MKRLGVMGLIVAVAMVTGCSGDDGGTTDGDTTTVTYWVHSNPAFVKANEEVIARYEAENPGVDIEMEVFPAGDYQQKLRTAFAGKQTADVIQIYGSEATPYIRNGLLAPVPADVERDLNGNFFDVAIGALRAENGIYGVPQEVNLENGGVLYDPELLAEAGYDEFPTTWDELIDAAKKATKTDEQGNITQVGFDYFSIWNNALFFFSLVLQQGGDYWDESGVHVDYSTPEARRALEEIVKLHNTYQVTDFNHLATAGFWEFFFQGDSAMAYVGPWAISVGYEAFERDDFSYGLMPSFTGDSYAFASETGWSVAVSTYAKDEAAAWDFVRYLTNEENSLKFNIETTTIPSRNAVADAPEFLEANPLLEPSLAVLPEGRYIGPLQNVWHAEEILVKHFRRVIDGEVDAATALEDAEAETNSMIDEQLAQ